MIPRSGAKLQSKQHKETAAPTTNRGKPNNATRPNMPYKRFLQSVSTIKSYSLFAVLSMGLSTANADSKTPRLGLTIPDVGSPQWGTKVNNNFQILDSTVNINGGGGGGGTPGGSTSQVQFNNSGTFAGASGLTYNTAFGVAASTVTIGPALFPTSPANLVTTSTGTTEAARFQCNGMAGNALAFGDDGCVNMTLNALSDGFVINAGSITDSQNGAYLINVISGPNWNDPDIIVNKQGSGSNPGLQIRAGSQAGIEFVDTTLSHNLTTPQGKYKIVTRSGTDAFAIAGRNPQNNSFQSIMDFYREGSVDSWSHSGDANVVLQSTAAFGWTNYAGSHAWLLRPNPTMTGTFLTTLPAGYGTNGQAIVTDGAGNLSYQTISGSSSTPVVVQSSGIAFGSSTSTVTSDASSLSYNAGTKTITMTHAASGGSYLVGNDTNVGNNIDYLLESDGSGTPIGYLGSTNFSSTAGSAGITVFDGSKNELARFTTINGYPAVDIGNTSVGISTMNVKGNMTIGNTYAGIHAVFNTGYAAPPSGLAVEGQTVIGTTVPVSTNLLTVQGGVAASSFTATGSGTGSISLLEGSQATVPSTSAGTDVIWADSTKNWTMINPNGGVSSYTIVMASGTLTSGHLLTVGTNGLSAIDGGAVPSSGGTPAGNPYDVQVDSNGIFGGYDNFQNNGTTVTLNSINAVTQNNVSSQTATGVNFNYSGSSVTLGNQGTYNIVAPLDISGGTGEMAVFGDSNPSNVFTGYSANPAGGVGFRAAFGYANGNAVMQGGTGRAIEFDAGTNTFGGTPLAYISQTGNLGIGTSVTPTGKLQVSSGVVLIDGASAGLKITSAGSVYNLQVSSQAGGPYVLNVSSTGHINSEGITGSTVTACGTAPTISAGSNDFHGTITVGSGSPTACTLTFAKPYTGNGPDCVVSDNSTTVVSSINSTSTTQLVMALSAGLAGKITYICVGSD